MVTETVTGSSHGTSLRRLWIGVLCALVAIGVAGLGFGAWTFGIVLGAVALLGTLTPPFFGRK